MFAITAAFERLLGKLSDLGEQIEEAGFAGGFEVMFFYEVGDRFLEGGRMGIGVIRQRILSLVFSSAALRLPQGVHSCIAQPNGSR